MERFVRQGYHVAPYPFLFVVDVLGYMLDDKKYGLQGLLLLVNSSLTSILLADNTFLYLLENFENIDKTFKVLDLYFSASKIKLNYYKTRCI